MADDHGYDGYFINSILDLTDSEKVLDSHSHNGLCARWITTVTKKPFKGMLCTVRKSSLAKL